MEDFSKGMEKITIEGDEFLDPKDFTFDVAEENNFGSNLFVYYGVVKSLEVPRAVDRERLKGVTCVHLWRSQSEVKTLLS